jgi:glycolate oxidase iron-sulfur subunit
MQLDVKPGGQRCDHKGAKLSGRSQDCVLCGKCLEVCPLFAATGREELSPRAKFFLAKTMRGQGAEISEKIAVELAAKCLGCGKCEKACPFGLCAPELVSSLKAAHKGLEAALWKTWVEKAGVLWPMMATLSRLVPRLNTGGYARLLTGLKAMDAGARLTPWLRPVSFEAVGQGRRVVVFPGCVASHVQSHWTATAERLLTGLGFTVLPRPDFACCGCTMGHAGLKDAQQGMQLKNVQAWRHAGRPELMSFCATCRCGLRGYASRDLGWQPGEQDLWLAGLAPFAQLAARARYEVLPGAPERVRYHTPCHGAGGGQEADFLLSAIGERFTARTHKNLCCGFGGALKLTSPELSDAVAKRCIDFYGPMPGEQILTGCSGCVIQLRANAPEGVGVGHWLEIIGE